MISCKACCSLIPSAYLELMSVIIFTNWSSDTPAPYFNWMATPSNFFNFIFFSSNSSTLCFSPSLSIEIKPSKNYFMSLLAAKKLRLTKKWSTGILLTSSSSSSSISILSVYSIVSHDSEKHLQKNFLNVAHLFFFKVPTLSSSLIRSIAFSLKSVLG